MEQKTTFYPEMWDPKNWSELYDTVSTIVKSANESRPGSLKFTGSKFEDGATFRIENVWTGCFMCYHMVQQKSTGRVKIYEWTDFPTASTDPGFEDYTAREVQAEMKSRAPAGLEILSEWVEPDLQHAVMIMATAISLSYGQEETTFH